MDCDLGSRDEPELPDGGRIPVEPDLLDDPARPDQHGDAPALPRALPADHQRARRRPRRPPRGPERGDPPRPSRRCARPPRRSPILRRQNTLIRDFIEDADTVSAAVEPVKEDVARWAEEAADTTAIQASRSEQLGRYWNRLPDFLAELEPTMAELEPDRAAPDPDAAEAAARPRRSWSASCARRSRSRGSRASRSTTWARPRTPATRRCARRARRCAELRRPVRRARRGSASRCGSSSRRSTTAGARPRTTRSPRSVAPPAPDKTAYKEGQGFTGMEALLELRLLPDARHQRVRRVRPPAADRGVHRRALLALRREPHAGGGRRVRLLARARPAGRARPARPDRARRARRARARGGARARGRAGRAIAAPASRARRPAPGRARPLAAAGRAARGRAGAARPPRRAAARRRPAGRTRRRPRSRPSSSTTCWGHEAPARNSFDQRQPGARRGGHACSWPASRCYLACSANSGLPFVPTYDVKAEIPGGSNLVAGQRGAHRRLPRRRGGPRSEPSVQPRSHGPGRAPSP